MTGPAELTTSCCAVFAAPPAYPDVALITPLTCWNTACTPQKQPPATTMVSVPAEVDSGTSNAGSGTAIFAAALDEPFLASPTMARGASTQDITTAMTAR